MPYAAVPSPASNNSGSSLYVGLMSGTSLDGIDGVLADFSLPVRPRVLAQAQRSFSVDLRSDLLDLTQPGINELERAAHLSQTLSSLYAEVVHELVQRGGQGNFSVAAVGCHGQTVRHRPEQGFSLQLVNGALLAELTGMTVITDFRSGDIAAGGQGAPLVPAFHEALFRHSSIPRLILNLGGIANLTLLIPGRVTRGYDIGPANLLMDGWIGRCLGQAFDREGGWAAQGHCHPVLLESLLAHPFFQRSAPKSTGREDFSLEWLAEHGEWVFSLPPEDVQATLLELTARSVAAVVQAECREHRGTELYLCGGGALNTQLTKRLRILMPEVRVGRTEDLGVPVQQVEALAFAWLAWARVQGKAGNLPEVTGARHGVVLGALYSPPS
ncbi:anhydro-N-acetylmuramic acid kinase [Ferrovum myxofaciens]|nr:anhydro-N-acetylmuramic acid kinase [Ferrovum myxofaciens]MBW8029019.1 anhydro-N-acetylmuramic acid kinase [Ferrovum sp.]